MSKISVAIPTHDRGINGGIWLSELFETLMFQTFKDFNVVISDQSTNNIISDICDKYKDQLDILYIHCEGTNPCKNINTAIENSSAEIIKIMFSDDLIVSDNYLERVYGEFQNSDKKWLVSSCNHTDGINYYRDVDPKWNENILTTNTISSPSVCAVLREYVEKFDENVRMLLDTDFYYRMYYLHGEPIYLNDVKISNREHSNRIGETLLSDQSYPQILKKEIDYVYAKNQKLYFEYLKKQTENSEYYLVYKIEKCGPPWFGACISWVTAMYSLAIVNEARFYMATDDNWRLVPNTESNKNWNYFFDSFELSEWKESEDDLTTGKYSIRFEDKLFKQLGRKTEQFKEDQTIIGNALTFCPQEFSNPNLSDEQNLSLFKSLCLKDVYKPKKEYSNLSDKLLENIGDYIAVHIRRGDKVKTFLKEGNYIPTSRYHDYCISIFKEIGIKNVFICSDSDDAINEFITHNETSSVKLNVFYDKDEVRHDGYPYKVIMGELDESSFSLNEVITAFKNIEILSKANYLVGTPASWFFRISQVLRISSENISGNCFNVEDGTETYLPTFYHC
jgi:hypothetical protein